MAPYFIHNCLLIKPDCEFRKGSGCVIACVSRSGGGVEEERKAGGGSEAAAAEAAA